MNEVKLCGWRVQKFWFSTLISHKPNSTMSSQSPAERDRKCTGRGLPNELPTFKGAKMPFLENVANLFFYCFSKC